MTFLLDVNVVIALIDENHVHHLPARRWFIADGRTAWATCPITQNGALRIVGNPGYVPPVGSPAVVAQTLAALCILPGHQFWADDISLLDPEICDTSRLSLSRHLTDSYLLALAASRGGKLATFDRRLVTDAIKGGRQALHLIEP